MPINPFAEFLPQTPWEPPVPVPTPRRVPPLISPPRSGRGRTFFPEPNRIPLLEWLLGTPRRHPGRHGLFFAREPLELGDFIDEYLSDPFPQLDRFNDRGTFSGDPGINAFAPGDILRPGVRPVPLLEVLPPKRNSFTGLTEFPSELLHDRRFASRNRRLPYAGRVPFSSSGFDYGPY